MIFWKLKKIYYCLNFLMIVYIIFNDFLKEF